MRKLFIFQNLKDIYSEELNCAFRRVKTTIAHKTIENLDINYLIKYSPEVVVSNGLPKELYYLLKGLNVVTITLDNLKKYYKYTDIVIDCLSDDKNKYFTGKEYSICKNKYFDIEEVIGLIKKLDWDSRFFGINIAYLCCMHLTDNIMTRINKFIKRENIQLVEYLCNCHDSRSVKVAEKNNFSFTDIRLTFYKELKNNYPIRMPRGVVLKKANKNDISFLEKISKNLYLESRYFFDENFGKKKAQEFFQNWVKKGVLGQYDDECWCLYNKNNIPFSFCTIRYDKDKSVSIGLFGIDPKYQGKGWGKILLYSTFNILFSKGIKLVTVVTQGRNYGAQRLYQSVGFKTKTTQLWYHKWL